MRAGDILLVLHHDPASGWVVRDYPLGLLTVRADLGDALSAWALTARLLATSNLDPADAALAALAS
jgi:hypothetical protein